MTTFSYDDAWPREEDHETEKGRVYVDSEADAPEGVELHEGPRGGIYYEDESGDENESSDDEEENPSQHEEQPAAAEQERSFDIDAVGRYEEYVPTLETIVTEFTQMMGRSPQTPGITIQATAGGVPDAAAFVDQNTNRVELTPKAFDKEYVEQRHREGDFATGDPRHVVLHELAHTFHHERVNDDPELSKQMYTEADKFADQTHEAGVDDEVSNYAARNPFEFVAEVMVKRMVDDYEPTEAVHDLYDYWGGPNV